MTPHLHAHPFRLVLVTESPTAPTCESAFLVCMGHRIQGADPETVARNATLDGTLKGVSILPYSPDPETPKGQTKREPGKAHARPKRKEYVSTIRTLLKLIHCEDGLDMDEVESAISKARSLLKK